MASRAAPRASSRSGSSNNNATSGIRRNLFSSQSQQERHTAPSGSAQGFASSLQNNDGNDIFMNNHGASEPEESLLYRNTSNDNGILDPGDDEGEDAVAEGGDVITQDDGKRLVELYRNHSRQRIDLNEMKAAMQESLRKKVDALDEDSWMYEEAKDDEFEV